MARQALKCAATAGLAAALMAVGLALPASAAPPSGPVPIPAPGPSNADPGGDSEAAAEAAPANDNHAAGRVLLSAGETVTGNTTQATVEPGEPQHDLDTPTDARRSVWFTWTAPSNDWVSFDTRTSSFDTVLAVYVGTTIGSSTRVADNDDDPYSDVVTSRVLFQPVQGTVYHIALDGYDADEYGSYRFRVGPVPAPANNNFANAERISGPDSTVAGYNVNATREAGEPSHDPPGASTPTAPNTIWYRWRAPGAGTFTFDTCDTAFDTVLAVYTGNAVNNLSLVAADDDSCGLRSSVTIHPALGGTYYIMVSGFSASAAGPIDLDWAISSVPPPANDSFANRQTLAPGGGSLLGSTVSATVEGGESPPPSSAGNSVWYSYTSPSTRWVTLDMAGSEFLSLINVYTGGAPNALTPVVSSMGWISGPHRVRFRALAGTTYAIAIDAHLFQSDGGLIQLGWGQTLPSFSDVPVSSQFFGDVEWMNDQEITTGYPDGTYRPSESVNRGAMAAFLARFYGGGSQFTGPATPTFSDVPPTNPFYDEIEAMVAGGVISGFPDGTYRPGAAVSRQAMSAFMYRLAGEPSFTPPGTPSFNDVPLSSGFYTEIEWMNATGITTGFADGGFHPSAAVSRQAMSAFMHRLATVLFSGV